MQYDGKKIEIEELDAFAAVAVAGLRDSARHVRIPVDLHPHAASRTGRGG